MEEKKDVLEEIHKHVDRHNHFYKVMVIFLIICALYMIADGFF